MITFNAGAFFTVNVTVAFCFPDCTVIVTFPTFFRSDHTCAAYSSDLGVAALVSNFLLRIGWCYNRFQGIFLSGCKAQCLRYFCELCCSDHFYGYSYFCGFLLARVTVITAVPSLEVAVILPFLSTVATDFLEDVQLLT